MHVLAGARVVARPPPLPDRLEHGVGRDMPVVHRRHPQRVGQLAILAPGEQAVGDRHIRRARRGHASGGDALPGDRGEQGRAGEVAGLALVGAHAEGGIAFQMLHRSVAFARRERDVGGGHIVVQIDKRVAAGAARQRQGERARRRLLIVLDRRHRRCLPAAETAQAGGAGARGCAFRQAHGERKAAAGGANDIDRRINRVGYEGGEAIVEAQLPLRLCE